MNSTRTVLLVEDQLHQYVSFRQDFEEAGWKVLRAEDRDSVLQRLEEVCKAGQAIDAIALDLGLPPDPDNPLRIGVPLAQELRRAHEGIPLLTYTAIQPRATDFAQIIARILPLRASFIYTRQLDGIRLSYFLDLTWRGYVTLSPAPADFLPETIATKPDPLADQVCGALWETLRLLSEGQVIKEIGQAMPDVTPAGVKARLGTIRTRLTEAAEIETTDREDLISWYKENHVRYRRGM